MNAPDTPRSRTAADLQTRMLESSARHGFVLLEAASFEAFATAAGDRLILFIDDPVRVPEAWDAVVLLPELVKLLPGRFAVGLTDGETARSYAPRYGLLRRPALLFLRDGGYVGAIEGLRDWDAYAREFAAILARPLGRVPAPVVAAVIPGCH